MPATATTMPAFSEDAVRTRAYLMWEADGKPLGRDDHYWGLAVAEMTAAADAGKPKRAAASTGVAATKRKPKAAEKKPAKKK